MGALSSFPRALKGLVRNPIILLVAGLYGLVTLPQLAAQSIDPMVASIVAVGSLLVYVILVPFYQGGIIGMAFDGLDGPTSFGTFVSEGKSNFVSMLVAYLVFTGVIMVVGFAVLIALAIVGAFVLGTTGDGVTGLLVLGGLGFLAFLAYLLAVFFVQFYGHAIVIDDQGFVDAFKRSVGLVKANVVSVLGYTLITGFVTGILIVFGWGASFVFTIPQQQADLGIPEPSVPILAVAAVVYVISVGVAGGFWAAYSVSYYDDLRQTKPLAA